MTYPIAKGGRKYPLDLYHRIFEPEDGNVALEKLASDFWNSDGGKAFIENNNGTTPLRVLAVGVGNGRTELPLLAELARISKRPLHVDCIEPNWDTGHSDFFEYAIGMQQGYCAITDSEWHRNDLDITLLKHSSCVESWLEKSKVEGLGVLSTDGFNVILFIFVAHLLADWKSVTADLLVRLAPGGLFVYAENTKDIVCLDGGEIEQSGEEASYLSGSDWGRFWNSLYEIRDSLMISRQMLFPPRNADFLTHVFKSLDACSCEAIRKGVFYVEIDFDKELSKETAETLIKGVEPGTSAITFGALRIPDNVEVTGGEIDSRSTSAKSFVKYWQPNPLIGLCPIPLVSVSLEQRPQLKDATN